MSLERNECFLNFKHLPIFFFHLPFDLYFSFFFISCSRELLKLARGELIFSTTYISVFYLFFFVYLFTFRQYIQWELDKWRKKEKNKNKKKIIRNKLNKYKNRNNIYPAILNGSWSRVYSIFHSLKFRIISLWPFFSLCLVRFFFTGFSPLPFNPIKLHIRLSFIRPWNIIEKVNELLHTVFLYFIHTWTIFVQILHVLPTI